MTSPARTLTDADLDALAERVAGPLADALLARLEERARAEASARQRPKAPRTVVPNETDRAAIAALMKKMGLRRRA